ncbi:hypothetical protein DFR52_1011171 [Hoeflea marina]|uniref:LPS sulfotransferase NodH n=1 Tax=Hoeflea marina TaxID=274592 RepID=A0A317PSN1_9HYPH|nr:hypothetical protein [Hoeflea marina]PWW04472.1 hypothetical protein DFR52_1011171 [Hoeflea marina]
MARPPSARWIGMRADLTAVLAPFQPGKVALLHSGRCGSELLGSLLGSNPRLHWAGEFVNEQVYPLLDPPGDYAGRLAGRIGIPLQVALSSRGWKARGRIQVVKTKRLHFAAAGIDTPAEASRILDQAGLTRRIVLSRRNSLHALLSWTRALATRTPHAYRPEDVPTGTVRVPLDTIPTRLGLLPIEAALELREQDAAWVDETAGADALRLIYEDDLRDGYQDCIVRIADFLSIEPWKAETRTVRTGGQPLERAIENFDALVGRLSGTRWASML